jgi:predicted nucleic acid-binding Zn ribbon protein
VIKLNIPVHVYECEECILVFAVEMAFEDQSEICCPNCGNEDINDVAAGELNFQK